MHWRQQGQRVRPICGFHAMPVQCDRWGIITYPLFMAGLTGGQSLPIVHSGVPSSRRFGRPIPPPGGYRGRSAHKG